MLLQCCCNSKNCVFAAHWFSQLFLLQEHWKLVIRHKTSLWGKPDTFFGQWCTFAAYLLHTASYCSNIVILVVFAYFVTKILLLGQFCVLNKTWSRTCLKNAWLLLQLQLQTGKNWCIINTSAVLTPNAPKFYYIIKETLLEQFVTLLSQKKIMLLQVCSIIAAADVFLNIMPLIPNFSMKNMNIFYLGDRTGVKKLS